MGAGDVLSYCARVSNGANQTKAGTKLIRYLIEHEEWSPLEMVSLTMEIDTTRDISRQMLRHRSFSFQEFSQRYAAPRRQVRREFRLQDKKNRQNSIEDTDDIHRYAWYHSQMNVGEYASQEYEYWILQGAAKEVARVLLPEGLTPTTLYMAGTLRSWYHYCKLRTKPETQKEHRLIAEAAWRIVQECFPAIAESQSTDVEPVREEPCPPCRERAESIMQEPVWSDLSKLQQILDLGHPPHYT